MDLITSAEATVAAGVTGARFAGSFEQRLVAQYSNMVSTITAMASTTGVAR